MNIDSLSDNELAALLDGLRHVEAHCGTEGTARTIALVLACIDVGVNLDGDIAKAITRAGFDHGHIRQLLKLGNGEFWARNGDRTLSNLN